MSSLVVSGDTSGSVTLQAPAVSGTTVLTLPATSGTVLTTASGTATTATTATNLASGSNGTIPYQTASGTTAMLAAGTSGYVLQANGVAAPTWVTPAGITLGTPVATTSGTSIDITGIPSGVKRVTIMLKGVSTNGSSRWIVQLGDSGGIETTGYVSGVTLTTVDIGGSTLGLVLGGTSAARVMSGSMVLTLENSSTYSWTAIGCLASSDTDGAYPNAGGKSLSGVLDRIRLTTVAGADAFDAGEINILYE